MRRKHGFSLIETMVAVALLGLIVVTILSGFSATTLATTRHQQETTLDRLTRSEAEYIKSQAYSAAGAYLSLTASGYSFSYQVLHYNKNSNPTFAAGNPDTGLQQIVLTVTGPNNIRETLNFLKELP